jgi:hypothetical protein
MKKQVTNLQTGVTELVDLTAEEIAEREAYERDVLPVELRKSAEANRAAAYSAEADPLFFKSQRGESTTAEWEAKVAEIKTRFPYPEEA